MDNVPLIATYYGQRYALEQIRRALRRARDRAAAEPAPDGRRIEVPVDLETGVLVALLRGACPQDPPQRLVAELEARGLVTRTPEPVDAQALALRYARNPIENVSHVIFEYTSRCDFACAHCYNAAVPRHTETEPQALVAAAATLLRIGVRRFDFIGGEVSKLGDGWLEVVAGIQSLAPADEEPISILLCTNGWFLEREGFAAAGRTYSSAEAYLTDLKQSGVTHVLFSLDGPAAAHDRSRGQPGLFARILRGLELVKRAGLIPRVSLLVRELDADARGYDSLLAELAERIYELPRETALEEKIARLVEDPTNIVSSFIDIGSGASRRGGRFPLRGCPTDLLRCKGFFRPAPRITIKATGELATCRVTTAGEGYGNIHQHDLVTLLNRMDESFVFRLHAEERIAGYVDLVDEGLFGSSFGHMCTLRAILTLIARRMEEQGIDAGDRVGVRRVNEEVAALTGHAALR